MSTSFKLKLFRQDVAVGSIPVLNENSFLSPPTINKRPLADCTNDIKVQYVERVGGVGVILEIETYIELLSADIVAPGQQSWQPEPGVYGEDGPLFDITYLSTFRPFNDDDYDGTCSYYFEVVAQNRSEKNSGYVYLVDENDVVVATVEVPVGCCGDSDSDYYRFREEFTPNGSSEYGLRTSIANIGYREDWIAGDPILYVTEATIVIHQVGATKSSVHIPMMTYVNTGMAYCTVPTGEHRITDGHESITAAVIYTTEYPDCEMDEDDYSQNRQIWRFSEEELADVDRFVFDASLGYEEGGYVSPSTLQIVGTPDLSWVSAHLRWSTVSVSTPQEFIDGCSYDDLVCEDAIGDLFTYIEGSSATWAYSADGNSWSTRVYLDIDSLMAADGHNLYISSNEDAYGGDGPSGTWHHWRKFRAFSVSEGYTIESAWIDYEVYYDNDRGDHVFNISFDYILSADGVFNPAYIKLYDITADEYVEGSELHWDEWTLWERKSVELSASKLISGHEYIARWKIDEESEDYAAYPLVSDINLYAYITDITAFTSWRRISKMSVKDFIFGYIDEDWCVDCENDGCIDIHSRAKLFLPDTAEVYYECCVWDYSFADPSNAYIYSTGEDDNDIGSEVSERVLDSVITFGEDKTGFTYRSRSGLIESMINGYRYVDDLPGDYWEYEMLSGFIVVKYT